MSDLTVTVAGWVATKPMLHSMGDKGKMCAFRMAHTARYRNSSGEWVDGATEWFSVRMFRSGAQNVSESLRKGDPVIVRGRLRTSTWTTNEGVERTELQLDAQTVGHDLTKGVTRFSRHAESAVINPGEERDETDEALPPNEADLAESPTEPSSDISADVREDEVADDPVLA